jgi:hypothetical protein
MSGIKYEVLAGDDLISALRGGRTGDLLDDAAYAAADEIERLQRVLQKIMARCADLLDEDQFNELDELLRLLNLDPDQYRTDGGSLNLPKVTAALWHPDEYPKLADAERYRWLQEHTVVTGLSLWMGQHQTLREAIDAERATPTVAGAP